MEGNNFDVLFERLSAKLKQAGLIQSLSESFSQLKSNKDRVAFLCRQNIVADNITIPDNFQVTSSKSSATAAKLKQDGNKLFKVKKYKEAAALYTGAISAAPPYREGTQVDAGGSSNGTSKSDLALAFANRSAALFHLERWQDCLRDIQEAFSCGYPKELRYKLYDRMGKCHSKLASPEKAAIAFKEGEKTLECAQGIDAKAKSALLKDFISQLEKYDKCPVGESPVNLDPFSDIPCCRQVPTWDDSDRHAIFRSLSDICDVIYTTSKGRHLVAKRDIRPGEVILIEKPFASVLLPELYETHCHHCYSHCLSLIPCRQCALARFCCLDCRQAALETYHKYECSILGAVHQSGLGKFGHLALRTVTSSGLAGVVSLKNRLESGALQRESPVLSGCNEGHIYKSDDYNTIFQLVTHESDRAAHDLFRRAVQALFLLRCLQKADFFASSAGDSPDISGASVDEDMVDFVGGLLLSHLQSFPCNAHEISELQLDKGSVATSEHVELGAGIYSTLSLFNHSCDPAVNRNFYGNTCVVRAIKPIAQGDEVADNYGAVFAMEAKGDRWLKLKSQYYFDCDCVACRNNWPLYPDIESVNPVWKCSKCSSVIPEARKQFAGTATCPSCQQQQNIGSKHKTLRQSEDNYRAAFEQLLGCDVISPLPDLLSHLNVVDGLLALPWKEFNNCQEAVKQCYSIMGNCQVLN